MEGMKELEHAPTRGERRHARAARPALRRKPLREPAEDPRPRRPRYAKWVTCQCGKVASESLEAAQHRFAVMDAKRGNHQRVEFYSCRFDSWHWARVKPVADCPGGGRSFEELADAVAAAESAMSRTHPASVKAVTYACFAGCFHWTWFPSWLRFTKCQCGRPCYPSQAEAAFMDEFWKAREPDSRSEPFQCVHGPWHLGKRRAPVWSASIHTIGVVTPIQAPVTPASLRPSPAPVP